MVQFKKLFTFEENNKFFGSEKNNCVEKGHSKLETPKKNQEIQ